MKDELIRLVTLQKFDLQVLEIEDHLAGLKKEITQAEERLDKAKGQTDQKRRSVDLRKMESKRIDGDIEEAERQYKENNYQLMSLKDAKSYESMKLQIEELRERISELESRGLEVLGEVEEGEKTLELYDQKISEEEARIDGLKENLAKEEESRSAERKELAQKREEYIKHIAPDLLKIYNRLLGVSDRKALAELKGRTCTGCYSNITLDNLEVVKTSSGIVYCNSCGRIVYLPSVLGAAEEA
jgi:uncharacterized protein